MHLFINSLAASAGGGLTYIRNVIPHLAGSPEVRLTVAVSPGLQRQFRNLPNLEFLECDSSSPRRFWYEQRELPAVIRRCRADVLISAGNFALMRSPVPQILLSRNSIYTSKDFYRDLLSRHEYFTWLDTRARAALARRSVRRADITVAPSESFAAELRRWTGAANIVAIHHGFDAEAFTRDGTPLSADVEEKLQSTEGALRLLFVSHYNYYRNFETLFRALPLIRERLKGRTVRLLLTCKLAAGGNPGSYRPEAAARLLDELGASEMVVEPGSVPYSQLHQLYRQADIYITPAYTETFAHPLVESMSCGLPVVASDIPVHKEICADAAFYFSRFSPEELAERVAELDSSDSRACLSANGLARSKTFSWRRHVEDLLSLARHLAAGRASLQ